MFVKPVKMPYFIKQYEAYLRRLRPGPLRDEIEQKAKKYKAGFNGEKFVGKFLNSLSIKDSCLFYDLRLFNGIHYFQIDFLLLTLSFFLILEVKNILGTMTLDFSSHSMIRKFNQKSDIFQDPTVQSEMLKQQFQDWMADHCAYVPDIPVEDLVVFAGPSTFVDFSNITTNQERKIVRGPQINKKIMDIFAQYPTSVTNKQTLKLLSQQLINSHHPKKIDLISSGMVKPGDLLKGVRCPHCGHIPMQRMNRNWKCPSCFQTSPKAHLDAFRDYCLINGPKITNKQCREFLLLDSSSNARYLLQSLDLKYEGRTRKRVYYLKNEDE